MLRVSKILSFHEIRGQIKSAAVSHAVKIQGVEDSFTKIFNDLASKKFPSPEGPVTLPIKPPPSFWERYAPKTLAGMKYILMDATVTERVQAIADFLMEFAQEYYTNPGINKFFMTAVTQSMEHLPDEETFNNHLINKIGFKIEKESLSSARENAIDVKRTTSGDAPISRDTDSKTTVFEGISGESSVSQGELREFAAAIMAASQRVDVQFKGIMTAILLYGILHPTSDGLKKRGLVEEVQKLHDYLGEYGVDMNDKVNYNNFQKNLYKIHLPKYVRLLGRKMPPGSEPMMNALARKIELLNDTNEEDIKTVAPDHERQMRLSDAAMVLVNIFENKDGQYGKGPFTGKNLARMSNLRYGKELVDALKLIETKFGYTNARSKTKTQYKFNIDPSNSKDSNNSLPADVGSFAKMSQETFDKTYDWPNWIFTMQKVQEPQLVKASSRIIRASRILARI